jgi:hypothetical protein
MQNVSYTIYFKFKDIERELDNSINNPDIKFTYLDRDMSEFTLEMNQILKMVNMGKYG